MCNKCEHRRKNVHPITHCIFDLDGTLLDTETAYEKVIDEILREHGHRHSPELRQKVMGRKTADGWKILVEELKLTTELQVLINEFMRRSHEPIGNCPLMPGVEKLLHHLRDHKVPLAIATSSSEDTFIHKTKPYKKLFSVFSHAVCGGSDPAVKQSKPNPDIYLVCASRFSDNPNPSNCLVFEDAPNGVTAAHKANMQCIAIPDKAISKDLFGNATMVLNSMEEFQPQWFGLPPYK